MTMITPSYLGETIEYSSLHACRSTLEDPTFDPVGHVLELDDAIDGFGVGMGFCHAAHLAIGREQGNPAHKGVVAQPLAATVGCP